MFLHAFIHRHRSHLKIGLYDFILKNHQALHIAGVFNFPGRDLFRRRHASFINAVFILPGQNHILLFHVASSVLHILHLQFSVEIQTQSEFQRLDILCGQSCRIVSAKAFNWNALADHELQQVFAEHAVAANGTQKSLCRIIVLAAIGFPRDLPPPVCKTWQQRALRPSELPGRWRNSPAPVRFSASN
ncbi:hypothetical protein [Bdellovibrio bacteriovorus]|uniref:hypothetical protein n=1 Tax=Bdellovibrio bacteriovorus TaxID=959 RepID=UPI0035A62392